MSARSRNAEKRTILNKLFARKQKANRKCRSFASRRRSNLTLEGLEKREMFAVSSLLLNGPTLVVQADHVNTSVTVSQVGSNIRITDVSTNRSWDYDATWVGNVEFRGGNGNDRFVNNVKNLSVRGLGGAGNDYLEGYDAMDFFYGGEGHDTLVGYGGNDHMWGENGDDVLRGMNGDDHLYGNNGNDQLEGGAGVDTMLGGDNADNLLGGAEGDYMYGENGHDRLNGQAGSDTMLGGEGNDVLVSIDGAYGDRVDSGNGTDTMWVDRRPGFTIGGDNVVAASSSDVVQQVHSFANGADRTLDGDNITDPSLPLKFKASTTGKLRYNNAITAGNTQGSNPLFSQGSGRPLGFSGGPQSSDIDQRALGDCWLLSGLGAIANRDPNIIRQNVVDFDDGTYGVRLGHSFYRVDNELPVSNTGAGATAGNLRYAGTGAQNSMWVAIVEKAFAHYRGHNSYFSLTGGGAEEVFTDFRMKNVADMALSSFATGAAMAADLFSRWTQGYALAIAAIDHTNSIGVVDGTHVFTVESFIRDAAGVVTDIILRNPWGRDGINQFPAFMSANGGTNANDGFFTVTVNQLYTSGGSVEFGQV